MKVFLDTNVLVSAVATRGLCADLFQVVLADHELILGATVLVELRRVLARKVRLPRAPIEELGAFLHAQAHIVTDAPLAVRLRDPKDRPILAEAVAGGADVLVTGDSDLQQLGKSALIRVLSPREFWELLKSEPKGR